MYITIGWDNDTKTILRYDIKGSEWDWDEIEMAASRMYELLDNISHPTGVIVHIRPETLVPEDAMTHLWHLARGSHPNQTMVVLVGCHARTKAAVHSGRVRNPLTSIDFAKSLDEARHKLTTCLVS
jgi:hypothetical protein